MTGVEGILIYVLIPEKIQIVRVGYSSTVMDLRERIDWFGFTAEATEVRTKRQTREY